MQLTVSNQPNEDVASFSYLGSILAPDGGADNDVRARIGKAAAVFRKLDKIWSSRKIELTIKLCLYSTVVLLTALYASETWKVTVAISTKLDAFHQKCLEKYWE